MKITLIKPGLGDVIKGYNINDGSMQPLQLAILAGMTDDSDDIILYDDRIEEIPFDESTDLVAITVESFNARRAYQISEEYQKRDVKVVLGGVHVTLLPDEAARYADSIVTGDAEPVWRQLLADAKKGKLKKRYHGLFTTPQKNVFPRRDIFKGKKYLPVSLIQFSRGCKFNCSFCSVSRFFDKSHTVRNIDDVLYEIEKDKLKTLLFVDDNMVSNKKELKPFLRELSSMNVKWASQSSIDMAKDRELLKLMADSGGIGNLVGFESININTLKWIRKSPNIKGFNNYKEAMEIFRDYGFLTWASFMIGNDFDNLDTIKRTVEFAIKNKFTLAFFQILTPYPDTEIYNQYKKEKRLLFDEAWWNHKDFRYNKSTFIPKMMTPDQLSEAAVQANKDFYSFSSISKRFLDPKTNMRNLTNMFIYSKLNYILKTTSV